MAKYRKKPVIVEADVYRLRMEDGFDCRTSDVNKGISKRGNFYEHRF